MDQKIEAPTTLYLEDLSVHQRFTSGLYHMEEDRMKAFAGEFDPQPFHLDEAAAQRSVFRGLAASGWHTAAVTMRLMVGSLPFASGMIGLGGEIAWPKPTRPGDTLRVESEIIEIVRGYNQLLQRAGLPGLELGIGISFQDSAPMYLMDGEDRIMISEALNESDRLSSCNKRVRRSMERLNSPFNVYAFQTVSDAHAAEGPEDFIMKYNLNGIRISEATFQRLQQEISLERCRLSFPQLWGSEEFRLLLGTVPIGNDIFRKIVVRASRIPQIDPSSFSLQQWTERSYYEVCTNPAVYAALEGKAAAGR